MDMGNEGSDVNISGRFFVVGEGKSHASVKPDNFGLATPLIMSSSLLQTPRLSCIEMFEVCLVISSFTLYISFTIFATTIYWHQVFIVFLREVFHRYNFPLFDQLSYLFSFQCLPMSLLQRRPTRGSRLHRLPSKSSDYPLQDGMSCPNSPAVKKVRHISIHGMVIFPFFQNWKLYKIKGELYQLDIVDCSGNDPFPAARKLSYISGDMFLIVSSVDNADSVTHMLDVCMTSFSVLFLLYVEVRQQIYDCKASRGAACSADPPCVFILNKADLPEHRWQTDEKEVAALIQESMGTTENFVVCSAADNLNIDKRKASNSKRIQHILQLHKMLRNELSADGEIEKNRRHLLRRMRSRFSREGDEQLTT
uniref:GTP-binding protein GEM n=1 Tax=Heterorhabditis bacteriophora TaxID=37862 RepID=A0A1I7WWZ6_HETBA